jgi:hypothetical protein
LRYAEIARTITHDVVTSVVEFLQESRRSPSVSENDDSRERRIVRELLSRVSLLVGAPDDEGTGSSDDEKY